MSDLRVGRPVAVGYEAVPENGAGPGVLVLHSWWGLNAFFRELCDRLAVAGFVAVAPDLWGGTVATSVAEAEHLLQQRDDAATEQALADALARLAAHPAVSSADLGVIGCSMGAAWAINLAGSHPQIKAVTLFYGVGEGDFAAMQAAFLGHFAEGDPWEEDEWVHMTENGLREAGRDVQFYWYTGAGHWFVEADRDDAYNADAAQLAWERTLAFLRERLAGNSK